MAQNLLFGHYCKQASHNGDLVRAIGAGLIVRRDVTTLGEVLTDAKAGRASPDEITAFDSTGLAIQDLAVALAAYRRYREDPASAPFEGVATIEVG